MRCFVVYRVSRGYKYAVQEAVKKEGKFFVFSRFLFSFFFLKRNSKIFVI